MLAEDSYWFAVSLRIRGDGLDPTTVGPLLGLATRHLGVKGEPRLGKNGQQYAPYETNLWIHKVQASSGTGFDDQIQMLFENLGERAALLKVLAHRDDVEAELFCGFGSGTDKVDTRSVLRP